MRLLTRKIKIWQIMVATAVLAGLFALFARFGVARATGMVLAIAVTASPIVLARRGRRLRTAAWVCSLYPLFFLGSIYAIWLTAWCLVGHRTQKGLDDPDVIGPIVQVPIKLSEAFLMGLPVALILVGPLVLVDDVQSFRSEGLRPNTTVARLLIPPIVWLAVFGVVWLGLFGIAEIIDWYWD